MPRTPDDMMSAVSGSLAVRTGRSLREWLALVRASGLDPLDQNAVRGWLRREHGVPQNSQWAIGGLGDDVTAEDRGTYIPFVRGSQFAAATAAAGDVDDEVLGLLRPAYEQNP